jgi:hypothetical protein
MVLSISTSDRIVMVEWDSISGVGGASPWLTNAIITAWRTTPSAGGSIHFSLCNLSTSAFACQATGGTEKQLSEPDLHRAFHS